MGDNYGLNDSYDYYEFELDSLDATASFSGTAAATDWPLFEIAGKGPIQNIAAIKILEIQIPFSYYVFNDVNNKFTLREHLNFPPILTSTVTIPPGNYNAIELCDVMAKALTAASQAFHTYTVLYYKHTGKFAFYNNSTDVRNYSFEFGAGYGLFDASGNPIPPNSGNKNPRLYIGFPPGVTYSQNFIGGSGVPGDTNIYGNVLEAPNSDSVSGPNYIYVNSQRLGSDTDIYLPKGAFNLGGGAAGPQLAKIPVTTQAGGVLYWADPDPQKWFNVRGMDCLTNVDFYLTLGNTTSEIPLRLNGLPFSLKLGILVQNLQNIDSGGAVYNNERVFTRSGPKRIRPTY